jgi:hypothetical protein
MKKNALLFFAIMFVGGWAVAQTNYQLPNPGFEQWDGGIESEPTYWNTFSSSDGSYASLASTNHHYRRSGHRPGGSGSYYLTIYTKSIMGVKANGNMTTGRVHAGAMSATSSENYNYTQRSNSEHCQPFTATPDSMYVWVNYYAKSGSSTASLTAIIHGDNDFKSPNDEESPSLYKAIATARTTRTTESSSNMQWRQLRVPFNYTGNSEARYILLNMTTNYLPGEGDKNDSLSIDDIEFIYSAWLTDLQFRGYTIPGFRKNIFEYTIHVNDLNSLSPSDITYTTEVGDATVEVEVLQLDCDTAAEIAVTVTAENGATQKHYTIYATTSEYVSLQAPKDNVFDIYPNPTRVIVTVEGNTTITIIDIQGRVVSTEKVEGLKSIDISSLPKGVYVVRDNYGATKKIVKN